MQSELQIELDHLLLLRDEQAVVQASNNYVLDLIKNYQKRLPEINQTPAELGAMSEKQQRFIMAERQKILRALRDKTPAVPLRFFEQRPAVATDKEKQTARRFTHDKKHADYIRFAFSFDLK